MSDLASIDRHKSQTRSLHVRDKDNAVIPVAATASIKRHYTD